jgi:hypothetical protein
MDQSNEQIGSVPVSDSVESRPMNMGATLAICAGGLLVPGLAHVLIGRWIRGLIFATCVLAMFGLGIAMRGKLYDLQVNEPLQLFAFIANIGA